jgi:hypothetical protein
MFICSINEFVNLIKKCHSAEKPCKEFFWPFIVRNILKGYVKSRRGANIISAIVYACTAFTKHTTAQTTTLYSCLLQSKYPV